MLSEMFKVKCKTCGGSDHSTKANKLCKLNPRFVKLDEMGDLDTPKHSNWSLEVRCELELEVLFLLYSL
jgi:hypothetical protein